MKVIKVGTSSASRIAQACDRCRSKKIRCDGIRPCCSQCANVGFECRTSDKLSRRAFPRGYTESLEERVRQLESELREFKDLLDEKDEKIDMLSKMHDNQRHTSVSRNVASPSGSASSASPAPTSASDTTSHKSPSSSTSSLPSPPGKSSLKSSSNTSTSNTKRESSAPKEDTFRIQASPLVLGVENSDSYFMGASSGRSFIGESIYSVVMIASFHMKSGVNITMDNLTPVRYIQAQNAREWQIMLRLPLRGFPTHSRLLSPCRESTRVGDACTTASLLRPVC